MMKITKEKEYHQILKLVDELPKKDVELLVKKLQLDIASKENISSLQDILLKAPTWSESDFEKYNKLRDHINRSRIA